MFVHQQAAMLQQQSATIDKQSVLIQQLQQDTRVSLDFLVSLIYFFDMIEIIITALKRSLRRLCFYTCLSFFPRVGHAWRGASVAGGPCIA